jgi:hypothetical protein
MISPITLFRQGTKKLDENRQAKENGKQGWFRVGTSGAVVEGHVIGTCHRIGLLRFLGIQGEANEITRAIWDSGEANEFVWERALEADGTYTVLRDKDIPIQFDVRGTPGSGSPDIVLAKDGIPVYGIELKIVESSQSAVGLWLDKKPKADNLIQAAHYAMRLNIPYSLVYTYNGISDFPYWAIKKYGIAPKTKLQPFKMEFGVEWRDDRLWYTTMDGKEVKTSIDKQSIENYYEMILDMQAGQDLYLPYTSLEVDKSSMPFDKCKYCTFSEACTDYESHNDYNRWLDDSKRLVTKRG